MNIVISMKEDYSFVQMRFFGQIFFFLFGVQSQKLTYIACALQNKMAYVN